MACAGRARPGLGMDRFEAHLAQQAHHAFAVHHLAFPSQHDRQFAAAIDGMLEVQFVEPAHQFQVLFALGAWLVVVGRPTDLQQFALASNTRLVLPLDQRSSSGDRPNCLHFFLSQSRSTVSWPIF